MTRPWAWLLLALALALVTLATLWMTRERPGPRFQGRGPGYWCPRWTWGAAQEATASQRFTLLLAGGPDAVPLVIHLLQIPNDGPADGALDILSRVAPRTLQFLPRYRRARSIRWSLNAGLGGFLNTDDSFRAVTNLWQQLPSDSRIRLAQLLFQHPRNREVAVPFLLNLAQHPRTHEDALEAGLAFLQHADPSDARFRAGLQAMNEVPPDLFDLVKAMNVGRILMRSGPATPESERWMQRWLSETRTPHLRPIAATVLSATAPDRFPFAVAFDRFLPWRSGAPIRQLVELSVADTSPPHPQRFEIAKWLAPVLDFDEAKRIAAEERKEPRFTRDAYPRPIVGTVLVWFAQNPEVSEAAIPWLPPLFLDRDWNIAGLSRRLWERAEIDGIAGPWAQPPLHWLGPAANAPRASPPNP